MTNKEFTFGEPLNPQPDNAEPQQKQKTGELDLQTFMDDMQKLGDQVKSDNIKKTDFGYGSLEVTNYLIWLALGELMKLNDKLGGQ